MCQLFFIIFVRNITNMKSLKSILLTLVLFSVCASSFGKSKERTMYIFGVATSLTDSIVYVTETQKFEEIELTDVEFSKTLSRYSVQLQNYVSVMMSTKFQTGVVYFSRKKKTVDKDKNRVVNKFIKKNQMLKVDIPKDEFEFKFVPLIEEEEQ